MGIRLIIMPYRGERGSEDRSDAPQSIADDDLLNRLGDVAGGLRTETVSLTPDEDCKYGEWQRVALANRHLANAVAAAIRADEFPIGLLANCNALPGMLAGLQRTSGVDAARVGLIWIDAHADFNTPETTLSGMLGGMPVAISAGLCLHRLREIAGMTEPIDAKRIVMAGLRDIDPLEQELLDDHGVQYLRKAFAQTDPSSLATAARSLATSCDAIYVHVDMDVLDPAEVPGHPLTVEGGPTSKQLAGVLETLFAIPQICALGIASTPPPDLDPAATARQAAHRLVLAAAAGIATATHANAE